MVSDWKSALWFGQWLSVCALPFACSVAQTPEPAPLAAGGATLAAGSGGAGLVHSAGATSANGGGIASSVAGSTAVATELPPSLRPPAPPRPLVLYPFETDDLGAGKIVDALGAHDGVLNNPAGVSRVADRTGFFNALKLGGNETAVSLPDLIVGTQMTLGTWIYFDSYTQADTTLFAGAPGPGSLKLAVHNDPGDASGTNRRTYFTFRVEGNTGGDVDAETMRSVFERLNDHEAAHFSKNQWWGVHPLDHYWVHVAVAYDSTAKQVTWYLNGLLDSVKTFETASPPSLQGGRIGAGYDPGSPSNGAFDDFAIYDHALSRDEASATCNFERDLWANRDGDAWKPPVTRLFVDGTSGDDSHDGSSQAQAVRTVARGLSLIDGPGVRLTIGPGLYREGNLTLAKSGTRFAPISIDGAGVGGTVISGSEQWVGGWTKVGDHRYQHPWPYDWPLGDDWSIDTKPELVRRREVVIVNDRVLRPYLDPKQLTDDSFAIDASEGNVYVQTDVDPNAASVEIPIKDELLDINANFVTLTGVSFVNASNYYNAAAVAFNASQHVLVEDVTVSRTGGIGLSTASAQDVVIRRFGGYDAGYSPLAAGFVNRYVLVEDSEIVRGGWRTNWGGYTDPDPAAVGKNTFVFQLGYRRINVTDNYTRGLWWDSGNWWVTLTDSYIARNPSGMWTEANPEGIAIQGTEFVDNGDEGLNITHTESIVAEHDVFSGRNALSSWEPPENLNRADPDADQFNFAGALAPPLRSANRRFSDNLVVAQQPDQTVLNWPGNEWILGTMISARNAYFAPGGVSRVFQVGDVQLDWPGWQARLPQDSGSTWLATGPFAVDGTATVGFQQGVGSATQSIVPVAIPVLLSKPIDRVVSVQFCLTGSAKSGLDYVVKTSGPLIFQPKQRLRAILLEVPPGATPGADFTLTLSSADGANLGANTSLHVVVAGA